MKKKTLKIKLSNLLLVAIVFATILGICNKFFSKEVIQISAIAKDNYGYLQEEQIKLNAKKIAKNLYEVELSGYVKDKKIADFVEVCLGNSKTEVEVANNKIILTNPIYK